MDIQQQQQQQQKRKKLDDSHFRWVPFVTVIRDDIGTSIYEGEMKNADSETFTDKLDSKLT